METSQDPHFVDEMNGFEGDNYATAEPMASRYEYTLKSEPTIYNATMCGKNNAGGNKEQYGVLARRGTLGHVHNVIFNGFQAGLDVRNVPPSTIDITHCAFDSFVCDYACTETVDDDGFDEVAYLSNPMRQNLALDTGPVMDCFNANAPDFTPVGLNAAMAKMPPSDGFFDPPATFVGAIRDANDTWVTLGAWVFWTEK